MPETYTLNDMLQTLGAAGVIANLLFALTVCFLGYPLFRVLLVVGGALVGGLLGCALMTAIRTHPTGLDFFVLGFGCAVLVGMASWWLYRLMFALGSGAGILMMFAGLAGGQSAGWVLGLVAGLTAAVLAAVYMRFFVILMSGLSGGLAAAGCIAVLLSGLADGRSAADVHLPVSLMVVGGLILSAAGIAVQYRLIGSIHTRMEPDASRPRRRRPGQDTGIHPRFSKM